MMGTPFLEVQVKDTQLLSMSEFDNERNRIFAARKYAPLPGQQSSRDARRKATQSPGGNKFDRSPGSHAKVGAPLLPECA
jgi:hypothetical protein